MNAYTYFHSNYSNNHRKDNPKATFSFKDSPYMTDRSRELSIPEQQLKFLNPGACRYVNPCSETFWKDLKAWLSPISYQAACYPKALSYRYRLEPYLLRRVTMIAKSWKLQSTNESNGLLRLTLMDVRLSHVYSNSIGAAPNITVDHMNVWVSQAWMNLLPAYGIQAYGSALTVTGILYEYVSSKNNTRNIGILPILLEPKRPNSTARQNRRIKRPDIRDCLDAFM